MILSKLRKRTVFVPFLNCVSTAITLRYVAQLLAHSLHPNCAKCRAINKLHVNSHHLIDERDDNAVAYLLQVDVNIDGGVITA